MQQMAAALEARYQAQEAIAQSKQTFDLDKQLDQASDEPADVGHMGDSALESGKHKGMTMREAYQIDKSYVQ